MGKIVNNIFLRVIRVKKLNENSIFVDEWFSAPFRYLKNTESYFLEYIWIFSKNGKVFIYRIKLEYFMNFRNIKIILSL